MHDAQLPFNCMVKCHEGKHSAKHEDDRTQSSTNEDHKRDSELGSGTSLCLTQSIVKLIQKMPLVGVSQSDTKHGLGCISSPGQTDTSPTCALSPLQPIMKCRLPTKPKVNSHRRRVPSPGLQFPNGQIHGRCLIVCVSLRPLSPLLVNEHEAHIA